jgi:S-adenosylmethionine:tRNA ribosyltransferase-isomerase
METSLFDYHLPKKRIAQKSVEPRDHSRLLVLDRKTGAWTHRHFYDIGQFLKPGDLLVVNESKVFKARLHGRTDKVDADVEVFLLRPVGDAGQWLALAKPGRKLGVGSGVTFPDGRTCEVMSKQEDGTVSVDFRASPDDVIAWTDRIGEIPTPPYVERVPSSPDEYQTVYAKTVGSVAAPTAGFHFTPELMKQLKSQGVEFATVTLHVGLGTFRPMKTRLVEEHEMHEEWINIQEKTQDAIRETKKRGNRVIAVGTTTVRALESGITNGFTKIFITPGYQSKTVNGLITNFHLPKSTLLVLVSSFAGEGRDDVDEGRRTILHAYEDAIAKDYRFYSFGDAMLIV